MTIYKYLAPCRVDAIKQFTLRATQPTALNDPFEIKPVFASVFRRDELQDHIRRTDTLEEELKRAFDSLPPQGKPPISSDQFLDFLRTDGVREELGRLLGLEFDRLFEDHLPRMTDQLLELMHTRLGGMVGIVSFSGDPTNQLMWAHYADSHKGFVLGFDQAHPFFDRRRSSSDEFFHLRPVEYFDPLPTYSSMSELDGARLLCAKHGDWRYEQEQRVLVPLPEGGDPEAVHLINFPAAALTTVILGDRTPLSVSKEIGEVLSGSAFSHVVLQQARVDIASRKIRLAVVP